MTGANDSDFQQRMGRVEELIERIDSQPDPSSRELARRLTQSLLELHEVGLRRMLELLPNEANEVPLVWQNDPLISNLLILHRLHPLDIETRIEKAIADLQPLLLQHQVQLETVELTSEHVRLQMSGGCGGCASSEVAIRRAIDAAICGSAPELEVIITSAESSAIADASQLPVLNQRSFGP